MKKKIIGMLSLMLCLLLSVSLVACNKNKHEAKSEWKWNDAQHWHECATKGHDDKLDEAEHTWDDGVITTEPTETAEGVKTFTCTVCKHTKTESVAKLTHTHTFAEEWTSDETKHWHASTCGHDVKKDEANHAWDDGVITTPATTTTPGVKTYTCTVCDKTKTEPIAVLAKTAGTVSINASYVYRKIYDKTPFAAPVLADCTTNNNAGEFSVEWYKKEGGVYGSTPLAAAPVNPGIYKVVVKIAETDDYTEATAEKEIVIFKKQLTITGTTVADKYYDGTTTANVTVGTLDGVVNGDSVTISASGVFASAAAGNDITVTVTYLISGADSRNYVAPVTDATLTADVLDYVRFSIADRVTVAGETVVTGTVVSGIINVNDTLKLCGANGTVSVTVTAIEVNSTALTSVTPETEGTVGLKLSGVSASEIQAGDWLIASAVDVQKAKLVTVSFYLKTEAEGGRKTPVFVNYRPLFLVNNKTNTATLVSFSGNANADMIMPGETVTATLLLTDGDYILVGDEFTLADGGRKVATGTILSIDGIEVDMTYDEVAGHYETGDVDFSKTVYANVELGDGEWKIIMDTGIATYKVYDSTGSEITVDNGVFTLGAGDTVTLVLTPVEGGGFDTCVIRQVV